MLQPGREITGEPVQLGIAERLPHAAESDIVGKALDAGVKDIQHRA